MTDQVEARLRSLAAEIPGPPPGFHERLMSMAVNERRAPSRPFSVFRLALPATRIRTRVALAVAALVVTAGAALAVVSLPRAPDEIATPVEAALTLPSEEADALRPLPGGVREVLKAETAEGTWFVYSIATQDKGPLVTYGYQAAGSPAPSLGDGIGGCPEVANVVLAKPCAGGQASGLPEPVTSPRTITTPAGPAYSYLIGRAADEVSSVALQREGREPVSGWAENGFYRVIDTSGQEVSAGTLVALDGGGRQLASVALQ